MPHPTPLTLLRITTGHQQGNTQRKATVTPVIGCIRLRDVGQADVLEIREDYREEAKIREDYREEANMALMGR